jgi:hypothetical protein
MKHSVMNGAISGNGDSNLRWTQGRFAGDRCRNACGQEAALFEVAIDFKYGMVERNRMFGCRWLWEKGGKLAGMGESGGSEGDGLEE